MDNVRLFPGVTEADIDPEATLRALLDGDSPTPERVLKHANDADLEVVVVIGYDRGGGLYFMSSEPDGPEVLWLLEKARKALLED